MKSESLKQPQGASYLIVGSGRLATHLSYYFSLLDIKFLTWKRKEDFKKLQDHLVLKPIVLLAISDSALLQFYDENLADHMLPVVHFSGALSTSKMISCHPLMTFGKTLYSIDTYKSIFFAVTGTETVQDILPALPNSSFKLKAEDKALYHALCVLSAAGAQKIWSQSENILTSLGVPPKAFSPYVKQIAENYVASGSQALTGPWTRGDEKTISQNLTALSYKSDSLHQVYKILKEGLL